MDKPITTGNTEIFARVVSVLETARTNVVRSVNSKMVAACWLIGREIVEEIQRGEGKANYARTVVENLSFRLNERYGKGFSTTNLRYFRQFYLEFVTQCVTNSAGFTPSLGWFRYRALMRVGHPAARAYYEREASSNGWSVRQLERQIHSLFFERLRIEKSVAPYTTRNEGVPHGE